MINNFWIGYREYCLPLTDKEVRLIRNSKDLLDTTRECRKVLRIIDENSNGVNINKDLFDHINEVVGRVEDG